MNPFGSSSHDPPPLSCFAPFTGHPPRGGDASVANAHLAPSPTAAPASAADVLHSGMADSANTIGSGWVGPPPAACSVTARPQHHCSVPINDAPTSLPTAFGGCGPHMIITSASASILGDAIRKFVSSCDEAIGRGLDVAKSAAALSAAAAAPTTTGSGEDTAESSRIKGGEFASKESSQGPLDCHHAPISSSNPLDLPSTNGSSSTTSAAGDTHAHSTTEAENSSPRRGSNSGVVMSSGSPHETLSVGCATTKASPMCSFDIPDATDAFELCRVHNLQQHQATLTHTPKKPSAPPPPLNAQPDTPTVRSSSAIRTPVQLMLSPHSNHNTRTRVPPNYEVRHFHAVKKMASPSSLSCDEETLSPTHSKLTTVLVTPTGVDHNNSTRQLAGRQASTATPHDLLMSPMGDHRCPTAEGGNHSVQSTPHTTSLHDVSLPLISPSAGDPSSSLESPSLLVARAQFFFSSDAPPGGAAPQLMSPPPRQGTSSVNPRSRTLHVTGASAGISSAAGGADSYGPASPASTAGPASAYAPTFAVFSAQRKLDELQHRCGVQDKHIRLLTSTLLSLQTYVQGLKGSLQILELGERQQQHNSSTDVSTQTTRAPLSGAPSHILLLHSNEENGEYLCDAALHDGDVSPSSSSTQQGAYEAARRMQREEHEHFIHNMRAGTEPSVLHSAPITGEVSARDSTSLNTNAAGQGATNAAAASLSLQSTWPESFGSGDAYVHQRTVDSFAASCDIPTVTIYPRPNTSTFALPPPLAPVPSPMPSVAVPRVASPRQLSLEPLTATAGTSSSEDIQNEALALIKDQRASRTHPSPESFLYPAPSSNPDILMDQPSALPLRPRTDSQGSFCTVDSAASLLPGKQHHHRSVHVTTRMEKTVDEFTGIKSLNQYVLMGTIGQGSCGKVKLAFSLDRNTSVAIKITRRGGGGRFRGGGVTPPPREEGGDAPSMTTTTVDATGGRKATVHQAATSTERATPEYYSAPVRQQSATPPQASSSNSGKASPAPTMSPVPFLARAVPAIDQREFALRREIAIMKKLRHKNIVALYEVIDDPAADKLYLIMQYVDRGAVGSVRPDGTCERLGLHQVLQLTRQVAAGLDYLHQHGIVHRDIKPENILYSTEDRYFLSDFGVSDLQNPNGGETANFEDHHSKRAGTRPFMAPELFASTPLLPLPSTLATRNSAGSPQDVPTKKSARRGQGSQKSSSIAPPIDIWALAITILALVTGRLPQFALDVIAGQDCNLEELTSVIRKTIHDTVNHLRIHTFLEYEDPTPHVARTDGGRDGRDDPQERQRLQIERLSGRFEDLLNAMLACNPQSRATIRHVRTCSKGLLKELDAVREHHARSCRRLAAMMENSAGSRSTTQHLRQSPPNNFVEEHHVAASSVAAPSPAPLCDPATIRNGGNSVAAAVVDHQDGSTRSWPSFAPCATEHRMDAQTASGRHVHAAAPCGEVGGITSLENDGQEGGEEVETITTDVEEDTTTDIESLLGLTAQDVANALSTKRIIPVSPPRPAVHNGNQQQRNSGASAATSKDAFETPVLSCAVSPHPQELHHVRWGGPPHHHAAEPASDPASSPEHRKPYRQCTSPSPSTTDNSSPLLSMQASSPMLALQQHQGQRHAGTLDPLSEPNSPLKLAEVRRRGHRRSSSSGEQRSPPLPEPVEQCVPSNPSSHHENELPLPFVRPGAVDPFRVPAAPFNDLSGNISSVDAPTPRHPPQNVNTEDAFANGASKPEPKVCAPQTRGDRRTSERDPVLQSNDSMYRSSNSADLNRMNSREELQRLLTSSVADPS